MITSETTEMNYFGGAAAAGPAFVLPLDFTCSFMQNNLVPTLDFSSRFLNFPANHHHHQIPADFCSPALLSCVSNNSSTSDESEEQQRETGMIDERKQRRMVSNRESARRSRMRKKRHLDELWSQVVAFRTENYNLLEKLNKVAENHDIALQENARLKEEASGLRQMLVEVKDNATDPFSDLSDL